MPAKNPNVALSFKLAGKQVYHYSLFCLTAVQGHHIVGCMVGCHFGEALLPFSSSQHLLLLYKGTLIFVNWRPLYHLCVMLLPHSSSHYYILMESNHRVFWVGKDLKNHLVPTTIMLCSYSRIYVLTP